MNFREFAERQLKKVKHDHRIGGEELASDMAALLDSLDEDAENEALEEVLGMRVSHPPTNCPMDYIEAAFRTLFMACFPEVK